MSDNYTETTTTSWGQRIIQSFIGVLVGILLFVGAFPFIWWNEGRSVDRIKTLEEGRGLVVSIASDAIDPAHEGKLVHLTGDATSDEYLEDPRFGLYEQDLLKLKRKAEIYQWEQKEDTQTEKNMGGSETQKTTYSYNKVWSDELIDSSAFKKPQGHENPATMPYDSAEMQAPTIYLGEFELSDAFTSQINNYTPFTLTKEHFEAMDAELQSVFSLSGNYYITGDAASPKIGDMRISFEKIEPAEMSAIGKQDGESIVSYQTKRGTIELLESGKADAATMFASAESENAIITWLLRAAAFFMMWIGLALCFGPIKTLGDVVPFIGSLLGAGIALITLIPALALSFITMALAWLVFRPLIGGILLAVGIAVLVGGVMMMRKRSAAHSR